jgi:hypothetical protein
VEQQPRQFLRTWLICFVAVLSVVAAFNVVVDPYLLLGIPRLAGFNARKPAIDTQQRLMKAYDVLRFAPHTLILGSSQVEVGLDAQHFAELAHEGPAYNLGLTLGTIYDGYRYLQHVMARGPVQLVVIGVEFRDFFIDPAVARNFDFEARLTVRRDGSRNPGLTLQHSHDLLWSAFSWDALTDSLSTLLGNMSADGSDVFAGNWDFQGFHRNGAVLGTTPLFLIHDFFFARFYSHEKPEPRVMQDLGALLDLCASRGIRVVILLNPSHADEMEMMHLTGQWEVFENWKRALAAMAAKYVAANQRIEIWDFCDYGPYTTETVPQNRQPLHWFFNATHYSRALGNMMLEKVFTGKDSRFGVLLSPENLESHLADIRAERLQYVQQRYADIQRVRLAHAVATASMYQ